MIVTEWTEYYFGYISMIEAIRQLNYSSAKGATQDCASIFKKLEDLCKDRRIVVDTMKPESLYHTNRSNKGIAIHCYSPFDFAVESGCIPAIDLFVRCGADPRIAWEPSLQIIDDCYTPKSPMEPVLKFLAEPIIHKSAIEKNSLVEAHLIKKITGIPFAAPSTMFDSQIKKEQISKAQ